MNQIDLFPEHGTRIDLSGLWPIRRRVRWDPAFKDTPPTQLQIGLCEPSGPIDAAAAAYSLWRTQNIEAICRDYQRQRVYRWEQKQEWWDKAIDLRAAATLIADLTGLPDIEVTGGRKNATTAWAKPIQNVVCLPPTMRTRAVACHEAAHLVTKDRHGPEFVRVFCRFLDLAEVVSEVNAVASAFASHVDVAPLAAVQARGGCV